MPCVLDSEERLTSETDSRKRADAEVVAWKFKYEKAEQEKLYAQTHQKTVEIAVEKKVPYEKCEKCDRTAYQKAKEKCDNRKRQLEKKYKNMTVGYESILFLLAAVYGIQRSPFCFRTAVFRNQRPPIF